MKEVGVGIPFTQPVNSGFCQPKFMLRFEETVIPLYKLFLQKMEKGAMVVSKRILDARKSSKDVPKLDKNVTKDVLIPEEGLMLKLIYGVQKVVVLSKHMVYNVPKSGMLAPHRFHPKGFRIVRTKRRTKGHMYGVMIRLSVREIGYQGLSKSH